MKKKLTKALVDELKPADKDIWVWDTIVDGFGVRVRPGGRKIYVARYRLLDANRTQRKQNIARCSDMPPEKARELARKIFAEVAEGKDPMADRRPTASDPNQTVENMFTAFIADKLSDGTESASEIERVLLKSKKYAVADFLGRGRHPASITTSEIVKYLASYYKRGFPGAADKARSYISSAYNWAIKSANNPKVENPVDWGVTINPVTAVARDPDATGEVDRNLNVDELRTLWEAVLEPQKNGFSLEVGVCLQIMIGTGQRVEETLRLDGSEIDLTDLSWNMPKHKTKMKKRPHSVPLPRQIIPGIMALKSKHGDGPLFPGRNGSGRIGRRSIAQAIRRWLKRNNVMIEHFTPRDIRRTWKSRAHDAGIDRFMRDLIQQHTKNDTGSKHYDRAEYFPQMREAMDKWESWIDRELDNNKPAEQIDEQPMLQAA